MIETVKECLCLDHARDLIPRHAPHQSGAGIILSLRLNREKALKYWILRNGEVRKMELHFLDEDSQETTHHLTLVK